MLLKKQENNGKVKAIYSSSNICASIFEQETKKLTIIFNNGGQYKYSDVSASEYMRFEMADSQGVIFNSHIKTHDFEKLDKVETKELLNEVSILKDNEAKLKIAHAAQMMIQKFKSVVTYHENTLTIEPNLIARAKEALAEYDKLTDEKA